ncbi:hypothetical protein ACOME3_000205 [Neoechinorhynchus agilis]
MVKSATKKELEKDLLKEAEILKKLDHFSVCVFDSSAIVDGRLILSYYPIGWPLSLILMDSMISVPPSILRNITFQIADGLHYLHSKEIIHMRLRSWNLLLSELGFIKISWFSDCFDRSRNETYKEIIDNLKFHESFNHYIAPEIFDSSSMKITGAIDMWSFGQLLKDFLKKYFGQSHNSRFNPDLKIKQSEDYSAEIDIIEISDELLEVSPVKRLTAKRLIFDNRIIGDRSFGSLKQLIEECSRRFDLIKQP